MKFTRYVVAMLAVGAILAANVHPSPSTMRPHVFRYAFTGAGTLDTLLIDTTPDQLPAELTGAYLTSVDSRGRATPELAREVPTMRNGGISRDGRTVVYRLRPGLRWSDGTPLTAEDAVFTAGIIRAKGAPVVSKDGWNRIVRVDAPTPTTLRFRLKSPFPDATQTFFAVRNVYSILPKRLLSGVDIKTASFNALPVGAGPFRYTTYARGDRIVMDANPFYFGGRPKLDRIILKFVNGQTGSATQILTGEIDAATIATAAQKKRLAERPDVSILTTQSNFGVFIKFLVTKKPLDDLRVRRALFEALDRTAILKKIYDGAGYVNDDSVADVDRYYDGGIGRSQQDAAEAGRLLDAAGWRRGSDGLRRRDGRPLEVDLVEPLEIESFEAIGEMIRSQWAAIGVTLTTRRLDGALFWAPGGAATRGEFDAEIYGQEALTDDLSTNFACRYAAPAGYDESRYCNARVDALLERADATYDAEKAKVAFMSARRLIAADVPEIPIAYHATFTAIRVNVVGLHPNAYLPLGDVMHLDVR